MEKISNDNTKCLQGRRLRKRFRCAAVVLYFGLTMQSPTLVGAQVSATSAPVSPPPFGTSIPTVVGRSPPPANIIDTPAPATLTPAETQAPSPTAPTISTNPPFTTTSPTLSPSSPAPFTTSNPTVQVTTQAPVASTEAPSSSPSDAPVTLSPTDAPLLPPTLKPTKRPTKRPTKIPTKAPVTTTSNPTVETPAPTGTITAPPTITTEAPTTETLSPSQSPTLFPSASPSIITEAETASPTAEPSKAGAKPTKPTKKPTSSTPSPTASPSRSANTVPTVPVVMLLENTSAILVGTAQQSWISVTLSFLSQSIQPQLQNLTISLNVTDQRLVLNKRQRRKLQTTDTVPLQISFKTYLSYDSPVSYKPETLVGKAFNSVSKRTTYVSMLQRTNDPTFANVNNVQVLVDGSIPAEEDIPTPTQTTTKSKFPIAIVAGAAAAGAFVLIVLVVIFVLCRDKKNQKKQGKAFSHDQTPTTQPTDRLPLATEIVMEPQDDISTLGDPMFPGSGGMLMNGMDRDENTASITDDYDYARQYRMAVHQPSESSFTRERLESVDSAKDSSDLSKLGLGKMSESFFSDDASFEEQFVDPDEQFEVLAPAGKLGMVIDTPSGGPPMVHAIKDSSVLADTVQVGDRLLAVDGESTVHMTAMQVSKLISLKANNSTRTLVFRRSRGVSATNLAQ